MRAFLLANATAAFCQPLRCLKAITHWRRIECRPEQGQQQLPKRHRAKRHTGRGRRLPGQRQGRHRPQGRCHRQHPDGNRSGQEPFQHRRRAHHQRPAQQCELRRPGGWCQPQHRPAGRQVAELNIRTSILNRFTELGMPPTVSVASLRLGFWGSWALGRFMQQSRVHAAQLAEYIIAGFGLGAGWHIVCLAGAAVALQTKEDLPVCQMSFGRAFNGTRLASGCKDCTGQAGSRPTRKHHGR